uniref:TRAP transporter substrate-binding protein DctP n=1 Tax=uncultured Allobacillus sp. TaxID=1638025 RepID=UPI0025980E00|nr:TRAP transporter substrate-binding protein DctP [uncultured Allobacillus sp.]
MNIFNKKYLLMLASIFALSLLLVACGGGDGDESEDTGSEDSGSEEESDSGSGEGSEEASGDFESDQWRMVTEELQGEVQFVYAQEFAKRIEEKTGGAITVEALEYGALGSETDQAQLLQQGGVELAVMSPGFTGGQVPDGQIFSMHYLFPTDQEQIHQILKDSEALNTDLRKKYEEHSISPLAYWSEGQMAWTSNTAIKSPSDWEGLNVRVQESPLMRESYAAYGATVQSLSWGELYTALDRETVDAQENPIFFIESASFNEVQDYMMISGHNNYVAMTTANTEWYNGLDDNVKAVVDETVKELQDWVFDEQKKQNEAGLQAIKDEGSTEVIEFDEDQIAEFREAIQPVHEYYREEVEGIDPELFDKLKGEIEEVTGE